MARQIADKPLASLLAIKRLIVEAEREPIRLARQREDLAFAELLRRPGAGDAVLGQLDGGRS